MMALELEPIEEGAVVGEEKGKLNLEPLDLEPIDEKKKTNSSNGSKGSNLEVQSISQTEQPYSWEATLKEEKPGAHPQPVLKPVSTYSSITPVPAGVKTPSEKLKVPTAKEKIVEHITDAFTDMPDAFVDINKRENLYRTLYERLKKEGSDVQEFKKFRDESEKAWQNAYGIQEYQKKLNQDPDDLESRYALATHQLDIGKTNDAATNYRELVQKNPKYAPAYTGLAYIASKNGHDDLAIGELNVGIEENPGDPALRNNRAIYKQRIGDYQGAVSDLDDAISLTKNPHLLQEMYTQRAKVFGKLSQDEPLVDKYIKILQGQNDPLADEIDKEYFKERYKQDFNTALRLSKDIEDYDKNEVQTKYAQTKEKISKGEAVQLDQEDLTIQERMAGYERGKGMAEAMEKFIDPSQEGLAGLIMNPIGFIAGQGIRAISGGAEEVKKGIETGSPAKVVKGALEATIGTIMAVTPTGWVFTGAVEGAKAIPYGEYATNLIMAPIASAAKAMGQEPGDLTAIADVVVQGLLLHKVNSKLSGAKEVAKKIENKEPLTPEDINTYKAAVENLGDKEMENVIGKELESVAEPVSAKELSAEKIYTLKNILAEKRPDLKEIIERKPSNEIISEMQDRGIAVNASGIEKYFDKVKIGEIKQPALSEIEQKRFSELSEIDEDLITQSQQKELERLKLKKEPAKAESIVAETPAKESVTMEKKVAPKEETAKPSAEKGSYDSSDGKYSVENVRGELRIADKSGKVPSDATKLKITKEYEDSFDYTKGDKAEDVIEKENIQVSDPKDMARVVAEKSSNPLEIVNTYQSIAEYADEKSYKNQIIDDYATSIDPASYKRYGDANNIGSAMAKRFFAKKGEANVKQIDTLAQEISEVAGVEVTPADIVDFMENDKYTRKTSPEQQLLADRFKQVTGLTLNSRTIEKAVSQELSKHNKDYEQYLTTEGKTFEDAKRQYEEAIYRGDIPESSHEQTGSSERVSGGGQEEANVRREAFVKSHIDELQSEGSLNPDISRDKYESYFRNLYDRKFVEKSSKSESQNVNTDRGASEDPGEATGEIQDTGGQGVLEGGIGSRVKETITQAGEALKRLNKGGGEGYEGLVKQGVDFDRLVDHAVKLIHAAIDKGIEVSEAVKQVIEDLKTTKLYKKLSSEKDFKEEEFAKTLSDTFTEQHKTFEEAEKQSKEFTSTKQSPEMERKSFIDTVKQGEKTTEGMKKSSEDLDEFYKAITNKETLRKADSQIREDLGEAKKEVLSDSSPDANKSAMAVRLIKHYESVKDYDTAIDILDAYDKQLREAGRFIQAASLWNKLSPETMVRTANKSFRKISKKEDLPKGVQKVILEKMQEIDKMPEGDAKTKATLEMLNFIADQMPLSFREKFDAYRYQNMLSNPRSHERNIYSNLLNTFLVRPLDIASVSTYDLLRSPFNPIARDYKLSNAPKYIQSAVMNIPNAWTAAVEAFKQGYVADKIMDIGDTANMIEAMRRTKLPKYLTVVSRLMESQDRFFSTIIAESEKARLLKNGLTEAQATIEGKKIGETYLYRDKLGVNDADMPIISRALDQAGKWITKGRNETVLGQALSWFVPFITTPINVAKFGIERSPLGFIGGKYGKTQVANATLGTLVTGVGAMLAAQDKTTWAAPKDKKERELFYASNRKPYSININGTWVPLQYFGPYALALALPAAYKNFKYDTKTSATDDEFEVIKDATIDMGKYISQQTPLSGLGGLFKAIEGTEDYKLPQVMGFVSEQVIPLVGVVKYVNSILDPVYRKSSGYLESIEKDLPGLSRDLPGYPALNKKGREDKDLPPPEREPVNYWLPYDVGFEDKEFELLLQKRRSKLKKRQIKKVEDEQK